MGVKLFNPIHQKDAAVPLSLGTLEAALGLNHYIAPCCIEVRKNADLAYETS